MHVCHLKKVQQMSLVIAEGMTNPEKELREEYKVYVENTPARKAMDFISFKKNKSSSTPR